MEKFVEIYLILYRLNNHWKTKLIRAHNATEAENRFRETKIFKHMVKNDGDRYMVFVFTGLEDYV